MRHVRRLCVGFGVLVGALVPLAGLTLLYPGLVVAVFVLVGLGLASYALGVVLEAL